MQRWRACGVAMVMLVAFGLGAQTVAAQEEVSVDIRLFQYFPDPVTVTVGTTVTWTNSDAVAHTVTADDHAFDSELFSRGETYSMTFDAPGSYPYYCIPHGSPGSGMIGVVEVVESEAEMPVAEPQPAPRPAPAPQPASTPITPRQQVPPAELERNKQAVVGFYTMAFNDKKPAEAVAQYVGPRYTQHNPLAADGPEAFIAFVSGFATAFPEGGVEIKRVLAEGDLVVTQSHFTLNPDDRGSAVFDMFRIENGKIVEHWDVIQPIPETPANDNTMF
jgi:predicted SnoaL-like aldol condensation-catalyzing enzyme/plastocyanin